jgi:hypothetical protein
MKKLYYSRQFYCWESRARSYACAGTGAMKTKKSAAKVKKGTTTPSMAQDSPQIDFKALLFQ